MEHIYSIKVKTKFDPRTQYPSERRYSASTVLGFAWVHLALALTTFLLSCLALYNPGADQIQQISENSLFYNISSIIPTVENSEYILNQSEIDVTQSIFNESDETDRERNENKIITSEELPDHLKYVYSNEYSITLVISPCLLALGAFVAGFGAIVASRRWYVDQSITWFLLSSVFSTILSIIAFCMIIIWIIEISKYESFCDYFSDGSLFGKTHIEVSDSPTETNNDTIFYVIKVPLQELRNRRIPLIGEEKKQSDTRKVLSINILISAFIEIVWSLLSVKIAWNGMRANYPDDNLDNRGNSGTVHVITEIKGNNTKHLPKSTKILPPQPDLIEHYPKNNKIKKIFKNQEENGRFFLQTNQNSNGMLVVGGNNEKASEFSRRESNSEYRERMMNFLNKCANNKDIPSPDSYTGQEPGSLSISELGNSSFTTSTNQDDQNNIVLRNNPNINANSTHRLSNLSWGDVYDHPIYTQNTLDLDKIVLCLPKLDNIINKNEINQSNNSDNDIVKEESIKNKDHS